MDDAKCVASVTPVACWPPATWPGVTEQVWLLQAEDVTSEGVHKWKMWSRTCQGVTEAIDADTQLHISGPLKGYARVVMRARSHEPPSVCWAFVRCVRFLCGESKLG
jgi:hypothetical protein